MSLDEILECSMQEESVEEPASKPEIKENISYTYDKTGKRGQGDFVTALRKIILDSLPEPFNGEYPRSRAETELRDILSRPDVPEETNAPNDKTDPNHEL